MWPGFLDCVCSLQGAEEPDRLADRAASLEQDTGLSTPAAPASHSGPERFISQRRPAPAGVPNATLRMSARASRIKPPRRLGPKFMGTDGAIGLASALGESWIWAARSPEPSSPRPGVSRSPFRCQTFATPPSAKQTYFSCVDFLLKMARGSENPLLFPWKTFPCISKCPFPHSAKAH